MARILIVDDEKSIRVTAVAFLEGAGHAVLAAESVDEAIRLIDANPVDVVVTDVLLPRRGGLELLHHVRQAWPHVQVILMTGEPNLVTASAAVRARAFDYLTKPVSKATLLDTVARAVMVKVREDEHEQFQEENRRYREDLEDLVAAGARELSKAEKRYRQLVELSPDAIMIHQDGKFVYVNPATVQLFGAREPADLLGELIIERMHPDFRNMVRERFAKVYEQQQVTPLIEEQFLRFDGTAVDVEVTTNPILHQDKPAAQVIARSITARKQAEMAVQAVSFYTRTLIEVSMDPFVTINPDGRITDVNDASVQATGVPRAQLIGTDFSGYFTEPEKAREGYRRVFSEESVRDYPLAIRHVSGRVTDVLYNASVYRGEQGQVLGVFAAARDITARKQAEEKLRESEERYRSVVEDQTEVICRFRADGTFTFVNEVFCRFFGKSALELLGSKWQPRVVPEDLPHIEERLRALSPANPVVVIENRAHSGTGQVHWMQFVNRGFFDAAGRLTETQAVGRDVTERRRAEQEIERRRAELQAVYDHAPFPMCVLDTERKVVFANHAFAVYAGRPAEQLVGQVACGVLGCTNALDDPRGCGFGPKCEACALRRAILDTIETGHSHHDVEHVTAVTRQGERRDAIWLGATARIPAAGRCLVLLALQDITERRRIQEASRQSEAAARARAEELLATRARLRALSHRLVEVQEAERRHLARELHDQVGQILAVLSFRLDMTRGELGAARHERIGPHLDECLRLLKEAMERVRTVMTELRPGVLDECGIDLALQWCADQFKKQTGLAVDVLTCELEGRLPPETETALFRIVQEALLNVAKHAQATQVTVALETTPNGLRLTVADNGAGFDADPTCRHPRADGQGWGLMTMSERALAVGAELRIESQPGKGTRVIVEISNQ
ncbi:MAG: hypothetical protein A3K18_17265 [Lentisphaerae bacterium RIFOXYA12_64_32]|nr:MAG: hypothetical protein A3K18_17265 [Lentisphaerae bacterium RIFOXYA12_64_32]